MFVETKREGETKPVLESWRQLLLDAMDLLEQRGHTKRLFFSAASGGVCLAGAVRVAINDGQIPNDWFSPIQIDSLYYNVIRHLQQYLKTDCIATWNDAPERTAEEVIAAGRACANAPDECFTN
jgi:hypothetical protein